MTVADVKLRYGNLLVNGDFSINSIGKNQDWIVTRNLFGW
jgi:hypothetical protein